MVSSFVWSFLLNIGTKGGMGYSHSYKLTSNLGQTNPGHTLTIDPKLRRVPAQNIKKKYPKNIGRKTLRNPWGSSLLSSLPFAPVMLLLDACAQGEQRCQTLNHLLGRDPNKNNLLHLVSN